MRTQFICDFLISIFLCFIYKADGEPTTVYMGCYVDGYPYERLMPYHRIFDGTLTPDLCNEHCRGKGFAYAGTEYSIECSCSKTKLSDEKKALVSECNNKCSGNVNKTCGGVNRLAVFSTGFPDSTEPTVEYMGCYVDGYPAYRLITDHRTNFDGTLTPYVCNQYCRGKGFAYAATEYSNECYCSKTKPPDGKKTKASECNSKCDGDENQTCGGANRLAVFSTGFPDSTESTESNTESTESYMGCYEDGYPSYRLITDHRTNFDGTLTPYVCNQYCRGKGFAYAATEYSNECYCSKTKPPDEKKRMTSECNSKCDGDENQTCGGANRLAVFSTGFPNSTESTESKTESTESYMGCYEDGYPSYRLLADHQQNFDGTLTPDICNEHCRGEGFAYAGTQYSKECFCSKTKPPAGKRTLESDCSSKCSGDGTKTCGGDNRLSVFSTGIPDSTGVPIQTPSKHTTPRPCLPSETSVSGKSSVCRGDVIFEDQFNTTLGNTWSHVVMIPDDPDFEYAVFTANPDNSFTRKNRLIIKPTFLNDTYVQTGKLHLSGCTGRAGSRECELQANSYNILPPLATARIHTRNSFTFRYGIVEIRAKLPLGDWLVPELWLEPRHRYYGPAYMSGRIKIAMNRGNSDLNCHGEYYGSNRLESGVVMGPANNVQKKSLTTKLPANWHDSFHNYTLIWSPESISFRIDNETAQQLIFAGTKLCEVIGFQNNECSIWSSGFSLAPFDRDFYISLGLSVGNARDFPDDCTNRGRPKPWKNTDPKAMLKFWQDKEIWKATWSEENSSLSVDYVRVTAL